MHRSRLLIALSAGLSAAVAGGCFPVTYVQVPQLAGRVVGSDDQPLSGATVAIATSPGGVRSDTLVTGPDGRFFRAEDVSVGLFWVMQEAIPWRYTVSATDGLRRSDEVTGRGGERPLWSGPRASARDLGDMKLR